MKNVLLTLTLLLAIGGCKQEKTKAESTSKIPRVEKEFEHTFSIEYIDGSAKEIVSPDTSIQELASGFSWTEGPVWIAEGKYLLFAAVPNNKVYKLDAQNDTITYLNPSGCSFDNFTGKEPGSNGLLLNQAGELVLMQHGDRRVSKMNAPLSNPKEAYIPLVERYEDQRLNSPNDAVYDAMGNLYFTDPPYGLPNGLEDKAKELPFQGVYCLMTTGELKLLDKELKFPNGIGIAPDGRTLYVAVSNPEKAAWYGYDISAPGKVANKRLFYDVTHLVGKEGEQGLPDGLKVHSNGNIFATGPGGVWIFNSQGKVLARIKTGQKTANCALTDDEKKLFMTADNYVLAVDLK